MIPRLYLERKIKRSRHPLLVSTVILRSADPDSTCSSSAPLGANDGHGGANGSSSVGSIGQQQGQNNDPDGAPEMKGGADIMLYRSQYISLRAAYNKSDGGENDMNNDDEGNSVSTIAMAISPTGYDMASTHGDHTVKVISCIDWKVKRVLRGHPRTPWCVKFHPSNPSVLASGCLGMQVRVWDIDCGRTIWMTKVSASVISLTFHPWEDRIIAAAGQKTSVWDYKIGTRSDHQKVRNKDILRRFRSS